jgi:ribosomal protein S18 acetylase RimI-like enzyme
MFTDDELFRRGADTLLASWEAYAGGSSGASVRRLPGVAVSVFPAEPERGVYNNALLEPDLTAEPRRAALDAMEAAYAEAGVTLFAAWVHERDGAMRVDVERRGYTLDTSTGAMGMALDDVRLPRPTVELTTPDWVEHLRLFELPEGLLGGIDHEAFHLRIARSRGENVAAALAFDRARDCGIYNVGTLAHARRRGLGTALTALHLHDAIERGCTTASLQSTPIAEGVYASLGFRDLGRFLEYVP